MLYTAVQGSFRRRLLRVIALPVILMLLLAGISIWQIGRLLSAMQWLEHTDQVIAEANRVERLYSQVESAIRGYLLTNDPTYLTTYQQKSGQVQPAFTGLVKLVSDNPSQTQRLLQIRRQYQTWSSYIPNLIAGQQNNQPQPLETLRLRNQLMLEIQGEMAQFIEVEERLRNMRTRTVQRTTQAIVGSSIAVAILLGVILAYFIWRQIVAVSRRYEGALRVAQEQAEVIQNSAQRLKVLHEIDQSILAAGSLERLAAETLSRLQELAASAQGAVVLFDWNTHKGHVLAGQIARNKSQVVSIAEPSAPIFLQVTESSRYIQDIAALTDRSSDLDLFLANGYRSFLSIPMRVEQQLIGNLFLFDPEVDAFSSQDQEIAQEVTAQLAIAIQQSRLREQLQTYATELEQRVAERTARLQVANEDLEAFSYTVAHDLRAPLRGVEGYVSALIEDYEDQLDAVAQDYIHQVLASIDRMNALVQDLLAYSHLSREEMQLTPISLTSVVAEAQAQVQAELGARHAEITVGQPLPKVLGHRVTLLQIVVNLLTNAVKFVAPNTPPKVYIRAEEKEQWVRLWVEDNGIGIEEQYQEQIFGVFERLHPRDAFPGTGIGLAIVRKGAERLGGQVGVESCPGQGSRFWVELRRTNP